MWLSLINDRFKNLIHVTLMFLSVLGMNRSGEFSFLAFIPGDSAKRFRICSKASLVVFQLSVMLLIH